MYNNTFEVSIVHTRSDAFVVASAKFVEEALSTYGGRNTTHVLPVRISDGQKEVYAGCLVKSPHTLESFKLLMSILLAEDLGIEDGALVQCIPVYNAPCAARVLVSPLSVDESEVVEQNALQIESQLLRHIQVVFPSETISIQVFAGVRAKVAVDKIEDTNGREIASGCAIMSDGTEFVVATRAHRAVRGDVPMWCILRCHSWRLYSNEMDTGVFVYVNCSTAGRYGWNDGLLVGFWDLAKASHLLETREVTPSFLRSSSLRAIIRLLDCLPDGVCTSRLFSQASSVVVFPLPDDNIPTATEKDLLNDNTSTLLGKRVQYADVAAVHGNVPRELLDHLAFWFENDGKLTCRHNGEENNGNVLLCGGKGSGKSTVIGAVLGELRNVHACVVQCKSAEKLLPTLQRALMEGAMCSPSILVLDNLEALAPVQKEQQVATITSTTRSILEDMLRVFTRTHSLRGPSSLVIIATCQSREDVHESLRSAFCFSKVMELGALNRETRAQLLRQVFPDETDECVDRLGKLMSNYTPFDIMKIAGPVKRASREGKTSLLEAVEQAVCCFTPLAHTGITFLKGEKMSLSSVVGLSEAKKALHNSLVLPIKHPELFARLPLKIRSGVLLYGASGCGKTFMVEAIVNAEGLNCIVVNGPEVFGKYIGQSEQKIREVFERAQAAAPCVLFFDEFDSVAPQRGVDNSGVTDRVVNQLLCYLDGVEARKDVYVVAASSRPDLIDAALLRPGRLDRAVQCPIPSHRDRVEFLDTAFGKLRAALTKSEIEEIASKTPNWTPADLASLVSAANLVLSRQIIDQLQARGEEGGVVENDFAVLNIGKGESREKVEGSLKGCFGSAAPNEKKHNFTKRVTMKEVREALSALRPSLTQKDIKEQERIHLLFSKEKGVVAREPGKKLVLQ
ncbi:putative Peroxisome biogenesis factor 1 N terminal ATPase [Trypanosoma vivax]|uniref:Peroxisomal ATPase PEX1 n=1 Tax=Trypanosoma vivax (strain Y486) TaxID=1055687 RepID=G0TTZ4_TRYVY|nr:putative peroxisome biogenesis factor 1 [Trypanosoma vivax]KAH8614176.1 putative Peroxisome biogenesis factor 1 N terminal ATPase [Trypanosoma vivax]CCC47427.1 putative peroxisome biogenesis factor 1 [Trypanosoma vivax Y486]